MNKEKRQTLLLILAPVLIVFFIYSGTLHFPFNYDDADVIQNNYKIKNISDFTSIVSSNPQRALLNYSFAVNYYFGKLNTYGYHIVNIALHLLNGIILFFLVKRLTKGPAKDPECVLTALLASSLFVSHPVNVESVTYISSRSGLLCAFFYLLALLFFLKADNKPKGRSDFSFRMFSLIFFIMSCFSKENGITLPLILLAIEYINESINPNGCRDEVKYGFRDWIKKRYFPFHFAYWIAAVIIFFLRIFIFGTAGNQDFSRPIHVQLLTQVCSFVYGMKLLFLPFNLTVDHYLPFADSFFNLRVIGSAAVIVLVILFGFFARRRAPIIFFSLLWILLTQLPTLVFPVQDVLAERWLYLPVMGFALLLSSSAGFCSINKRQKIKRSFILIIAMILFLYSALAKKATLSWENPISLWTNALKKSPINHPSVKALYGIGSVYQKSGFYAKAIEQYQSALKFEPGYMKIYLNLAESYMMTGEKKKSLEILDMLLSQDGSDSYALYLKGLLYHMDGDYENAEKNYKAALRINPGLLSAKSNLGAVYIGLGRLDEAMDETRAVIKTDPDDVEAHNNLGTIYQKKGDTAQALREFNLALKINPSYVPAYINLGLVYISTGEKEKAAAELKKAIAIDPGNKNAIALIKQIEKER
ncbi:MAG: tetratricopeptide repeat protein [Candidatus Schekmanbacteria bacterium]|nr:tetratricopeptide repeat protein [Candidatus Schekmanbacteria bacterium]